jgi:starch-binding outer membrane protein, SusD/RagB family
METIKLFKTTLLIILIGFFTSCDVLESPLEDYPKDQYSPQSLRQDKETMLRVLYGAYNNQTEQSHTKFGRHDLTTDYMIQKFGHFNNQSQIYQDFAWNSLHAWVQNHYTRKYLGINFANLVLDNIEEATSFEPQEKAIVKAEARFCRAFLYYQLYDEFGPVPLVTTTDIGNYEIPRAEEEVMVSFIQTELQEAAISLPLQQGMFGRATRGAALGVLCKFLLNQRRWEESAEIAQDIIDLGIYELYPDYIELFHVSSEPNTEEFIYAWSYVAEGGVTHFYIGDAYPPYDADCPPSVSITAAQWYTADWLVNSFEKDDRRRDFFKTKY